MRRNYAFVLEQTLGHVAHARNIERALAHEPDIDATVIKLDYRRLRGVHGWPALRTWSFQASWRARQAVLARLREGRLDALFIHTQVASLLAADLMRAVPTVISLDATPVNFDAQGGAYGHERQSRLLEAVKRRINRTAFDGARCVVTWCGWAAESLERDYAVAPVKTRVVHPGVDLDLFQPAPRRPIGGPVRVLFVGGNFARKGGYDLLEAVASLDPSSVELDVVTGDAILPQANTLCRVHTGLRPQSPELIALYRRADVFALPTRGDCFPQAIAEALACGLPIVASDIGGIPEMVSSGQNGWLVPPGDPRRLAHALESLITDAETRHRFGQASLDLARREHDALRNNRALFETMASVAARQPAAA